MQNEALKPSCPFVMPTPDQFTADLRRVCQGLDLPSPEDILLRLAKTFNAQRKKRRERELRFRSDLWDICSEMRHAPGFGDFDWLPLARRLDEWREETNQWVRDRLRDIPEDDPLRCPVSLLGAIDFGRRETAHTRALAWMLDPGEGHGFDCSLAHELVSHLNGARFAESVLVAHAEAEYPIDDGCRLDILIRGKCQDSDGTSKQWMLVIEAKVDAFESDRQLHIYDKWFANIPKETTRVDRVFLTPDGRTPNTSKERWAALSFLQVACAFRRAYPKLKSTPGYDFLRYYISGVLKDICGLSLPMIDAAKHADPYSCKKYLQSVRASNGESL